MKKSFLGSAVFHALVLLAALFGLPAVKPFEIEPVEAIQVDISNITDQTKVKAQSKSDDTPSEKPKPKVSKSEEKAKPQEKIAEEKKVVAKEAAKQEPEKVEKPVEEEKKAEDNPVDPDPLKDMLLAEEADMKAAEEQKKKDEEKKKKEEIKKKKAEEEKKKKAEADAKAKADAKKKVEAEKERKDLMAKIEKELLIDKSVDESQSTLEKKDEAGTPEKAEKDIQGTDDAMSATIIDGLRQRLAECWSIPPSVRETRETVDLNWKMSRDGNVVGQPVVVGGTGGIAAQQAAISAVMACAPYDWLPADGYRIWKEIDWSFEPKG